MFSFPHIALIIFTGFFVPIFSKYLKKQDSKYIEKFFIFCTVMATILAVADWVWEYHITGKIDPSVSLPLYLCSLFWLEMPFGMFSKNEKVKRIALSNAASTCLFGGILGLVFNVYLSQYPIYDFVAVRSLLYHFIMILGSYSLISTGYYSPTSGDFFLSFIPFAIIMVPSLILNHIYGWDYLYTAGGKGTVLMTFSDKMTRPVFLLCLWGLFWLCIHITFFRNKKNLFNCNNNVDTFLQSSIDK